jgi:hypothetical protein
LWRSIHQSYALDPIELELLRQMCAVLDRCDLIEAELKDAPLTVGGSIGQPRVNPLLSALREEEKMADRLASSLGVSMPGQAAAGKGDARAKKAARTRWSRAPKAMPASVSSIRGA